jgi:hypothetical protein
MTWRDWETWHRIFEAMTAVGTVSVALLAAILALRGARSRRAERRTDRQIAALLVVARVAAGWGQGGDEIGRRRIARARLLQLDRKQATILRAALDDMSSADERTLRRRLKLGAQDRITPSMFTPEAMLAEIGTNLRDL